MRGSYLQSRRDFGKTQAVGVIGVDAESGCGETSDLLPPRGRA